MRHSEHKRERIEHKLRLLQGRLERKQRLANERLEHRHEHMNRRFDRAQERIAGAMAMDDKQEQIVRAALQVLDEGGLNNLSLRRLGQQLHMQAPALYWHFKNKEVLIDYMAETILRTEFHDLTVRAPDEPWQDWLAAICMRLRTAMHAHRDGARIVAGAHLFPAVTLMRLFETAQESLTGAGLDDRRANLIISTAVHFTFGRVIEEQSMPSPEQLADINYDKLFSDYPHMAKNTEQTVQDLADGYDEFEDALRLIVGYPAG